MNSGIQSLRGALGPSSATPSNLWGGVKCANHVGHQQAPRQVPLMVSSNHYGLHWEQLVVPLGDWWEVRQGCVTYVDANKLLD